MTIERGGSVSLRVLRKLIGRVNVELSSQRETDEVSDIEGLMRLFASWRAFEREMGKLSREIQESRTLYESRLSRACGVVLTRLLQDAGGRKLKKVLHALEPDVRRVIRPTLKDYRAKVLAEAIRSGSVGWTTFLSKSSRYGQNMDERVVELPLALEIARLDSPGLVLDAGASLNLPLLRQILPSYKARIVHVTQSGTKEAALFDDDRVSYVFADLRRMFFGSEVFDRIICMSTLEHIGMDNTRYGGPQEDDPWAFVEAVREMRRVLKRGGQLMISVPYGRARNNGWFQTFGVSQLAAIADQFEGRPEAAKYYYYDGCWYEGDLDAGKFLGEVETDDVCGVAILLFRRQ